MTHQLKPHDAVQCKDREQWGEILKLAGLNDIAIDIHIYCYDVFIIFLDNIITAINRGSPYKKNILSFEDFCAKIKGEYKDQEIIVDISTWETGEVLAVVDVFMRKYCIKSTKYIDPGKYKLTRVDE